jgi:hypothetical protein
MALTYTLQGNPTVLGTGISSTITIRPEQFAEGMPNSSPGSSQAGGDTGVGSAVSHRPDTANNPWLETWADQPYDHW